MVWEVLNKTYGARGGGRNGGADTLNSIRYLICNAARECRAIGTTLHYCSISKCDIVRQCWRIYLVIA